MPNPRNQAFPRGAFRRTASNDSAQQRRQTRDRDQRASEQASPRVRLVESSGNRALTGLTPNIDGTTVADDDLVLLTAQTDPAENGVWKAHGNDWERVMSFGSGAKGQEIKITDGDSGPTSFMVTGENTLEQSGGGSETLNCGPTSPSEVTNDTLVGFLNQVFDVVNIGGTPTLVLKSTARIAIGSGDGRLLDIFRASGNNGTLQLKHDVVLSNGSNASPLGIKHDSGDSKWRATEPYAGD